MKSEIARVKKADPNLDHKVAFKKAAGNWKSAKSTFKVPSKGQSSKTRKNKLNFETHKGDKVFHQKGKFVKKSRKPYSKKTRKSRKSRK
jgi:hypothetical protein